MAVEGMLASRQAAACADVDGLLRTYWRTRDPAVRERLVRAYLPLVRALARRYANRGEQFDDLVQVGSLGLIEAIDRFDPERGGSLATFAVPTITGRLRNHLRDRTTCVRVPRRLAELGGRVKAAREELARELSRPPTLVELARNVGVAPADVAQALETEQALAPVSLAADDDNSRGAGNDDAYRASEDRLLLAAAFRVLGQRERRILHLRFFCGLSQAEIAESVGLSQVQVSRIIAGSLARMRAALRGETLATNGAGAR